MSSTVQPLASCLEQLLSRVAALEAKVSGGAAAVAASSAATTAPAAVPVAAPSASSAPASSGDDVDSRTAEFDRLVTQFGQKLAEVATALGAPAPVGTAYENLYRHVRHVIHIATTCKKPDATGLKTLRDQFMAVAKPIQDLQKSRDFPYPDLVTAAAGGVEGFFWVFAEAGPADLVETARDSAEFYNNKIRKLSKERGIPELMTFANTMRDGFNAMHAFVKEYYKTGLSYNARGNDAAALIAAGATSASGSTTAAAPCTSAGAGSEAAAASGSSITPPAGSPAASSAPVAAPAKPAAPAPAATAAPTSAPAPTAAAAVPTPAREPAVPRPERAQVQSALFAQLSSIDQSEGFTKGLRHVTKEMKSSAQKAQAAEGGAATTPASGGGGGSASGAGSVAAAAAAPRAATGHAGRDALPTGTPCNTLVDQRWKVEFQVNVPEPIHIDEGLGIKHEVYIYGCSNVVLYIDRKCKGIRIDTCRTVTLVVDSALSGIEVVNSRKIKIQVQKSVPSVAIDKTDGIQIGLSWDSRSAQVVTSKSSEMNVTYPVSDAPDAEWIEEPIPEQFVSVIGANNKVSTTVSDLYTH